jgi:hypothetical protein
MYGYPSHINFSLFLGMFVFGNLHDYLPILHIILKAIHKFYLDSVLDPRLPFTTFCGHLQAHLAIEGMA